MVMEMQEMMYLLNMLLNSSWAVLVSSMKNSDMKRNSLQALSTSAYCTDRKYPLYKLFQNRLYNCHPCRQDRADCLLLIDTRDEMNRVIISSGNRQSLGIALIRLEMGMGGNVNG